jgi:hypothetical protein
LQRWFPLPLIISLHVAVNSKKNPFSVVIEKYEWVVELQNTVRSESHCALTKGDESDVHERLYMHETELN